MNLIAEIRERLTQLLLSIIPIIIALGIIALMLWFIQQTTDIEAGPLDILEAFWKSITSRDELSSRKIANVIEFWIPLVLVSMGLVLTFRAGLWNIGVEGQMAMGGLFAAGLAFAVDIHEPGLLIPMSIIAAMIGGGLWAALAGILKNQFGVNEIFSGVALNAIANQITLQLIAGPWKPSDSDKAQYSRDLPEAALLPGISRDFDVNLLAIIIAVAVVVVIMVMLWRTRWGLQLKATGLNMRSALLLGVPVGITALSAIVVCGALAGIGGAHRVMFTYENVRGQFAGGIGFLGLLVVLLTGQRVLLVPVVALLFSLILAGATQLQFLGLDTSLTGVLQGMLVLIVFLVNGVKDRLQERYSQPPPPDDSDNAPDGIQKPKIMAAPGD